MKLLLVLGLICGLGGVMFAPLELKERLELNYTCEFYKGQAVGLGKQVRQQFLIESAITYVFLVGLFTIVGTCLFDFSTANALYGSAAVLFPCMNMVFTDGGVLHSLLRWVLETTVVNAEARYKEAREKLEKHNAEVAAERRARGESEPGAAAPAA